MNPDRVHWVEPRSLNATDTSRLKQPALALVLSGEDKALALVLLLSCASGQTADTLLN